MRRFIPILIFLLILSACGGATSSETSNPTEPDVLASATFLADIVRNIAGERLVVQSLLPVGADPHSYQPTPQDLVKINESKLLVINGLEYEHFLESLLENAGGERSIITASDGLEPHTMEDEENAGQMASDPHMWLDPTRVATYVENIRAGLTQYDPEGAQTYQTNADEYTAKLMNLDEWIKEQVAQIPPERRLLVTNHEALGYFSEHYGFTVIGTVLPSVSSDASASAGQLATLVDGIKASGASAIFLDASENPNLAQQIADETEIIVITDLHLESLTDGPPAATYVDMMQHNVMQIVIALR
jgi:ABC-type Zn uptake system ZnuABC Zn-binding protein ZnuA